MVVKEEHEKRLQQIVGPMIAISLLGYFVYHIIQGERGILSWMRLKQNIAIVQEKLHKAQGEQTSLEQRVSLLRPNSLDPDMLEEQARKVLNYAHKDEIIVPDAQ